jgi:hypothetical protein
MVYKPTSLKGHVQQNTGIVNQQLPQKLREALNIFLRTFFLLGSPNALNHGNHSAGRFSHT